MMIEKEIYSAKRKKERKKERKEERKKGRKTESKKETKRNRKRDAGTEEDLQRHGPQSQCIYCTIN